jgi:predicted metal-dependent phosphoesterase TrpH
MGSMEGFPRNAAVETAPWFDLQSHSTYSDGVLPPAEVVRLAEEAGVRLFALSDHDTVDGVNEAIQAATTLKVVPAVELSSVHNEFEDLHILGYGLDHTDPQLLATLADFRQDRIRRIFAMADRLRAEGFEIPEIDHPSPGRPLLAKAIAAQTDLSTNEIFARYLVPGTPTYVGRSRPTVQQAIEVIHAAGGLAVWAHPYWDMEEALATLHTFADWGIDGVEAFYATHTEEQTRALHAAARERGLLTTGSADFHGPAHDNFNRFRAFSLYGLEPDLGRLVQ